MPSLCQIDRICVLSTRGHFFLDKDDTLRQCGHMSTRKSDKISSLAQCFLEPTNPTHRQYEALRAYFVEGLPPKEVAERFGYSVGSFSVMCSKFRKDPNRQFFLPTKRGPQAAPKTDNRRDLVVELRKQNLSVYDISRALKQEDKPLSPPMVARILQQEGFARLPRRREEERPPGIKPETAPVANVQALDLSERQFRTKFGGLFLFLPDLARIPFDDIVKKAGLPGTKMIPAGHATRSLLALKLAGNARHSHVMSHVFDEGLALFAGLNVIPKRSYLTTYSCRIDPKSYPKLMRRWFDAASDLGVERGVSFDLDFHTIPFHGEDALVEKHYVSKRSRRQKGLLAFLARDADKNVFCYANAEIRKQDQNDEILNFVRFWKKRTGRYPDELVFDSKLTTYHNLNWLNDNGIRFITLRRRTRKMLQSIHARPLSQWRRIELENIARAYRTPRILDEKIKLNDYDTEIRQLTIKDLGHEEPTLLLTNQMRTGASTLIGRYARRMLIENGIEDGIDFFHMDALSSAVAMKVNLDLQLTLMASSLYRLMGNRIGNGYQSAKSRHIWRDFVDAVAKIEVTRHDIVVEFQRRAHNPLLISAGYADTDVRIPWLGNKRLRLRFRRGSPWD